MTDINPESDVVAAPSVPVATAVGGEPAGRRRVRDGLHFALRNKKVVGGSAVILAFLAVGLVAPLFFDYGHGEYVGPPSAPPSADYWFGTTTFGQNVFLQFAHGIRSTFLVGLLGGALAALIGMTIGFMAGYFGGLVDEFLNMLTNIVLVLPALAVLIILHTYIGITSVPSQALFIGLFSWPWVARAVRAQTFSLRNRDFVDLARLSGMSSGAIIRREIAPNMSSYLFMTFILLFGGAVLFAATLDFIGLGPTGSVSLGLMMNNAVHWSALQLGLWWWFIPPGLGITVIVGALYIMNVGLDEVFNPKLREM
ncbi:ABC transporter permease [Phytohabitans houttuyneae]|jgi:peptide/nickel transport system permease protein|uniref:Peptide ABC transporter permease n=1 Tax=Phytohabitans houttuyneae TaxID=1076126 RepID=A0A6V8KHW8_9ACTN|nr:ABC transporter permease [Phytohabitans houttuyneae]GFJ83434.1 peptide ABC transporter permease [Phytohabitans houttuyneae]